MTSTPQDDVDENGFSVSFNQDYSSVAVRSRHGYSLFSLNSADVMLDHICHSCKEEIVLVEHLYNTSLIVVVALNEPTKLKTFHLRRRAEICSLSYPHPILAVKMNRTRLVVSLETSIYVHDMSDMEIVHIIENIPPNPAGLCALSTDSDYCFLAYPSSATTGEMRIFDAIYLLTKHLIPAHDNSLVAIAFSPKGTEVATASVNGSIIRVFSIRDGAKLFEFQRGLKRFVTISSLEFSTCSQYLCCSSNTETVHIFKLDLSSAGTSSNTGNGRWMGYLSTTVSSYLSLALPSQVTNMFTQQRAFASATLPVAGLRHSCIVTSFQNVLSLLVGSPEGYLYVYKLPQEGGECQLIQKYDLRSGGPSNSSPWVYISSPIAIPTASRSLNRGNCQMGPCSSGDIIFD
ncbi:WD repeat domain phosphoinositide-interacting protein 2-like [Toxorhynchites rutilus septentrionalis]|uniref:WD repeat domain phosphoinositide-interacting protein 2-like n=1 Tax=Toxorhynchites rutilus septentrionalis TaxID=329112 RepID=UPI00247ACEAE|nr:WD repeat domain phosphoinositide-interacting protein 2-like [Toxorhynchites rutilus septentrionalis]